MVQHILGVYIVQGEALSTPMICLGGDAISSYGRAFEGTHGRALGALTFTPMNVPW